MSDTSQLPRRIDSLAENSYGKIMARIIMPPAMLLISALFGIQWNALRDEQDRNRRVSEELTKTLQAVQLNLADTSARLHSNAANDGEQSRRIERLEDIFYDNRSR